MPNQFLRRQTCSLRLSKPLTSQSRHYLYQDLWLFLCFHLTLSIDLCPAQAWIHFSYLRQRLLQQLLKLLRKEVLWKSNCFYCNRQRAKKVQQLYEGVGGALPLVVLRAKRRTGICVIPLLIISNSWMVMRVLVAVLFLFRRAKSVTHRGQRKIRVQV